MSYNDLPRISPPFVMRFSRGGLVELASLCNSQNHLPLRANSHTKVVLASAAWKSLQKSSPSNRQVPTLSRLSQPGESGT